MNGAAKGRAYTGIPANNSASSPHSDLKFGAFLRALRGVHNRYKYQREMRERFSRLRGEKVWAYNI